MGFSPNGGVTTQTAIDYQISTAKAAAKASLTCESPRLTALQRAFWRRYRETNITA